MQLDEFFDYKNELMKTVCSNEKIVRLITDDDTTPVPCYDLMYKYVFPYEYVPDTIDEGKTFVCFDVDILSVSNKTYYEPVIYVWVFTHKSKLRIPNGGGIRTDAIAVAINDELNASRYYGIGELNLFSVGRFTPIKDFKGRELTYSARDFNRPGISKKPPANRKNHD